MYVINVKCICLHMGMCCVPLTKYETKCVKKLNSPCCILQFFQSECSLLRLKYLINIKTGLCCCSDRVLHVPQLRLCQDNVLLVCDWLVHSLTHSFTPRLTLPFIPNAPALVHLLGDLLPPFSDVQAFQVFTVRSRSCLLNTVMLQNGCETYF